MKVIILGAGGFAAELYSWISSYYDVIGFYSDRDFQRSEHMGLPIIKDLSQHKGARYYIGIGDPQTKIIMESKADAHHLRPAPFFLHPSVVIGHYNKLEDGVIVCPKSVITCNTHVKKHTLINLNCTIGHNTVIGAYSTISPGANISGDVQIGECNYIGTNATIREKLRTTNHVTLGMGAVAVKDITHSGVFVGNPARFI